MIKFGKPISQLIYLNKQAIYLNQFAMLIKPVRLKILIRVLCVLIAIGYSLTLHAQTPPYPKISARKTAVANPLSPDPLISYRWADPKATDGLESYQLRPVSWVVSSKASFDLTSFKTKNIITVLGTGSIRFDFGQTNAGWLEFESDDLTGDVTMSISEYNQPAIVNQGAVNPVKTKAPVKHGNTYRLELNPELYEGVRFGWINVNSHTKNWHIKNLRLVCQTKPVNYRGSFACSDRELTRVWYTGAYTVKLNLLKDYFGAILMERSDRQSWTGDAYPSQAASMVAFGNYDFVKKNLVNTSGLNNGIASYSLYWVLSLIDYVNYTGDAEFAKKYVDNASQKLELAYQQFGKSPALGFYGWDERLGAGFENPNNPESQRAYAMLSIRAWREFGELMKQLGRTDLAEKYGNYANSKIEEIRKQDGSLTAFGLHAAADAVNTGLTDPQENQQLYNHNYTNRVNRVSYSPFNEYAVIGSLGRMNKYDDAISSIKDCWGGQIRYGGTTFFEVYRPSWNSILAKNDPPVNNQCGYTSLTHPWSAGVVKWLSEEVLGIKPLSPGFKTFEIVPHLADGLTNVKGATPTLQGSIDAEFDMVKGVAIITIPEGTMAKRIGIPIGKNELKTMLLNNRLIWNGSAAGKAHKLISADGYIYVDDLIPGRYTFKFTYKTPYKSVKVKPLPWDYAINSFKQDSTSNGQWKGKYGADGLMLFSYFKAGEHLKKLPQYVDSVVLQRGKNVYADIAANGVLKDTTDAPHALGSLATQDPIACLQTMTLDVKVNDTKQHQIAIYFLDWNKAGRNSAIEIFDLKTLNLLAPVQMVKSYQHGKYLVFNYSGSIRLRVNQVRGENAAISGLFFDQPK
jgi:alpha-L-rhamnosidase